MTAVWLGLGFGLLQLLAGIVIGWSLARRSGRETCSTEASQLHRLAAHVHRLIRDVHGQVGEHQTEIQRIRKELPADPNDRDGLAASIFRSVSRVIQANERLQDQLFHAEQKLQRKERQIASHIAEARTDALTSLPNRRAFNDAIDRQEALFQRNGTGYGLIHIDVDHFKQLNDRWGHPAGDEVLKTVAATIRKAARQTDLVARVGGEEFSVVVPDGSAEAVIAAAERIRIAVETAEIHLQQNRIPVTVSLGAAMIRAGEPREALIERSDAALYASKQAGRNCSYWHDGTQCRAVTLRDTDVEPPGVLSSDGADPTSAQWQDQSAWRKVCDDLRRSLADFVGRNS